jgi:hypothetical protein
VKVLFVMRHSGYVRNFESTLRLLCERGHHVHLALQGRVRYEQLDPNDIVHQLSEECQNLTYGDAPLRADEWGLLGRELRLGVDYLRYLEPEYDQAPKLRERAARTAPPDVLARSAHGALSGAAGRKAFMAWLRILNRAIPCDPAIDAFLEEHAPDVLAVTPLIEPGAPQAEYLRSARALGIRTACCVASWDNLTNKGLIHGPVDLVTVWNETMKREAIGMHGVPASQVAVTGAAAFDHWFDWRPSRSREDFCAAAGLPADAPYLLYVCSSKFVAPAEAPFIQNWLARLRASAGALRNAGVLVRPHPQNAEQWAGVDVSPFGPVSVWPTTGAAPVDTETRSDYFDSMYHSAAVVGLNTTAEIESAIIGRPVYTVVTPEFRDTQEGTLHFHYLREANGGALRAATSFDEHLAQLEAVVAAPPVADPRSRAFIEAFVRPYGIDAAATPRMVAALEQLAAQPVSTGREPAWASLVRSRLHRRAQALADAAIAQPDSYAARLAGTRAKSARRNTRLTKKINRLEQKVESARIREEERAARQAGMGAARGAGSRLDRRLHEDGRDRPPQDRARHRRRHPGRMLHRAQRRQSAEKARLSPR